MLRENKFCSVIALFDSYSRPHLIGKDLQSVWFAMKTQRYDFQRAFFLKLTRESFHSTLSEIAFLCFHGKPNTLLVVVVYVLYDTSIKIVLFFHLHGGFCHPSFNVWFVNQTYSLFWNRWIDECLEGKSIMEMKVYWFYLLELVINKLVSAIMCRLPKMKENWWEFHILNSDS